MSKNLCYCEICGLVYQKEALELIMKAKQKLQGNLTILEYQEMPCGHSYLCSNDLGLFITA